MDVRKTHRLSVRIDDPIYAGTFRSDTTKDLHVAKALDLFFRKYDAGVLTSSVLNIAIWKNCKFFHIFDGQARLDNCEIAGPNVNGTAKLILVQDLIGVLFIILEKSNVGNESFVLYGITVVNLRKLSTLPDDNEETLGDPRRRPSGYQIRETFRAVVQGSYHLQHPILPQEFQGRGHLIIAVSAIMYSKLVSASKWTKIMIDLIFNQSNIYLTDLARILGRTLDETFEVAVKDLLCDFVFGVYTAKIKVEENVIPGQGKKGKANIGTGIRDFFEVQSSGILEIKKIFYPIWKEQNKYYLLDPFACDDAGFRADAHDPEQLEIYKRAASCVTMNSSIDQLIETILENTESKEKDPFIIHGLNILYVKTGSAKDGSGEKVVFREKKTNRRPPRPPSPPSTTIDECATVIDTLPIPRFEEEGVVSKDAQYPQLMNQVEMFMDTFVDFNSIDADEDYFRLSYGIINPHRIMIQGTINCLEKEFDKLSRGRQGLVIAVAGIAQAKQLNIAEWNSSDIDQIIIDSHLTYEKLASWILQGSPGNPFEETYGEEGLTEGKVEESYQDSTALSNQIIAKDLEFLELSMLPKEIKIGDKDINLTWKMNVVMGEANPLANLGEALERYFDRYNELVFENKTLMYGIWRYNDKYFVLNPYGGNKEGWRNNVCPAALCIVDSIVELVNFLYGLLEFNDYEFIFHFIQITLQSNGQDNNSEVIDVPEIELNEKYKTKFLPVTDEDLAELNASAERDIGAIYIESHNEINKNLDAIQDEKSVKQGEESRMDRKSVKTATSKVTLPLSEKSINLCEILEEPKQPDAPITLNLALVTGIVKIEHIHENAKPEQNLEIFYEKLKYMHPPPFVTPPKKNLCDILDIKLASNSVHSLLSRFSIDSKLATKEKNDLSQLAEQHAAISIFEKSKLITLPLKKYFLSKGLPSGLTPIRAVNEKCIRYKNIEEEKEEECRKIKIERELVMVPENPVNFSKNAILPSIVPLGPCIMIPKSEPKENDCREKPKKNCPLTPCEKEDAILKKLVCSTENLLFEMLLPDFKEYDVS